MGVFVKNEWAGSLQARSCSDQTRSTPTVGPPSVKYSSFSAAVIHPLSENDSSELFLSVSCPLSLLLK